MSDLWQALRAWNPLDLLILAHAAAGVLGGAAQGFARLMAAVAGTAGGYAAAVLCARPAAAWATLHWPVLREADRAALERLAQLPRLVGAPAWVAEPGSAGPLSLAAAFVLAFAAARVVLEPVLRGAFAWLALGRGSPLDRLLGAVLGGLHSLAADALLLAAAVALAGLPGLGVIQSWVADSRIAGWLLLLVLRLSGWPA